jgi:hypothetical protein
MPAVQVEGESGIGAREPSNRRPVAGQESALERRQPGDVHRLAGCIVDLPL